MLVKKVYFEQHFIFEIYNIDVTPRSLKGLITFDKKVILS